ncbi:MAG: hypothetical protein AB7U73_01175 [Pirellulales bacterium]
MMHAARKRRTYRHPRQLQRHCHVHRGRGPWAGGHEIGSGDRALFVCADCWEALERDTLAEKSRLESAAAEALARFVLLRSYQLLDERDGSLKPV